MAKIKGSDELLNGPYFRCLKCGEILLAPKHSKNNSSLKLKCACSNDSDFKTWPPDGIAELLRLIISQNISTKTAQITAVILTDTVIKLLFRDLLFGISKNVPNILSFPKHVEIMYPVEDQSIKLIEEIIDTPVDFVFESRGFGDFLMGWKFITSKLESFSSPLLENITDNEVEVSLQIALDCLKVFSIIQNEILPLARKATRPNAKALLIVDDEIEVTSTVMRFMSRKGLKVFTALNGKDAVELFRENRPGYVLLDVVLPDMDGISVLKRILEIDKTAKIYFVTGIAGEAFIKQLKNSGAIGHIPKPISLEHVYKILTKK